MNTRQTGQYFLVLALALALVAPAFAQAPDQATTAAGESRPGARVMPGEKQKVTGVIVRRDADSLVLRDWSGAETTVMLAATTEVKEKKSNPFRGAKNYTITQLLRGLNVEVEGRGNDAGALVARKIRFSGEDLRMAQTVESRVNPVEGRLAESEVNARRLSGQMEELSAISNAARGGARAAQETADAAMSGVRSANERITATHERITALDDYQPQKSVTVQFKVGSAALSAAARAALDELAAQAQAQKGFLIEVAGFASADGDENMNRRLSERRAGAVIRYLAEKQTIPLRRIITPFGYGEMRPMADNRTREGRQQNRRVEVTMLVSRGLTVAPPASSNGDNSENLNRNR